ncbi:hypothetical protein GCM10025771_23200 [Niveibacterium umoris]|uniref:MSHA biogenesis protein MshK n=1 Tax=Niveibacterium umoris TaxID=1193620 RepID=A0A840BLH5_9RHOO|nr:MSHA biogenesis protein MshK [Niveibacterium umoris]MBB4012492.1 MSHA biogenesis protein MshK [Niveibacterium umoris]
MVTPVRRWTPCLLLTLPLLCHAADALRAGDPTRPPEGLLQPASVSAQAGEPLVLQSVLLAPDRRVAVISGQPVRVGGYVGNAKLVALDANTAVLQENGEKRVLTLLPGITHEAGAKIRPEKKR